jgi:ligand-binding sensor domain-containing protein/DNA-binding CsgD family transcriptional regulator
MKHFLFLIAISLSFSGYGQIKDIGSPYIQNYPKSVYGAGTQNWDIDQDQNGFIYFANNRGVLKFDGVRWDLIEIFISRPIRAVFSDAQNITYVGFMNDFGFMDTDPSGKLIYKSLRDLLPPAITDFDEIWKIYEIPKGIVFQTYEYLFILKDKEIQVLEPKNQFHFSFNVGEQLFVQEPGIGVFEYSNDALLETPWSSAFNDKEISAILNTSDEELMICTSGGGVFIYNNTKLETWFAPINQYLIENKVYCATKLIGNHYAFGTILNGVYITDAEGKIIQHINKSSGLQNNTVLSLLSDNEGNIWLGLDNGIDFIEVNSPLSYISSGNNIGTGYCSIIFDNKIYLGTNRGLYVKPLSELSDEGTEFELVKNTAGQVWSLEVFSGALICGHNTGTYQIRNNTGYKISDEPGAWKYIEVRNNPELLIGGHFSGLSILIKENDSWKYHMKIKGFQESSRFLCQDSDNEIWISHGVTGITRLILNEAYDSVESLMHYNSKAGLPSDERNIAFSIDNDVIISTINGIYEFNKSDQRFAPSQKYNSIFDINSRLMAFNKQQNGDIWYIADQEAGIIRINDNGSRTKINKPFMPLINEFVIEFESIFASGNNSIFLGIDDGFAHYSPGANSDNKPFKTFITKIEIPSIDSTFYLPKTINRRSYIFPFRKNLIRFSFATPSYEKLKQTQFSFFLENYSEVWSAWNSESYKEFNNLEEGEYCFIVKAKNIYDIESEEAQFTFIIKPPWQRSKLAIYSYISFFILLTLLFIRFIQYRITLSERREREKHEIELQRKEKEFQHQSTIAEKEIIRLKNEKLSSEMIHRDKELANQTMSIIQKNRMLIKLKEELDIILNSTLDSDLKTKLLVVSRRMHKEIDNQKQNQIFETYFEEVHKFFFHQLKQDHPKLSPRDLYLCAYIKMNLSSKEIASLLNITSRGIEISRYRLRKKLNLKRDDNLSVYLSNL